MRTVLQRAIISVTLIVLAVWLVCAVFLSVYGVRYWWATSMLKKAAVTTQPIYAGLQYASIFHIQRNWATPTVFCSLLLLAVLVLNVAVFVWQRPNRMLN